MAEVSLHLEALPWSTSPSHQSQCCPVVPCPSVSAVTGFLLNLQPCYSKVTLLLGSTIWCWCSLQIYENSLLSRAAKQPKLGVRWSQICFMNGCIFQTGYWRQRCKTSLCNPEFCIPILQSVDGVTFYLRVLFWIWYFAQTELHLFMKYWKAQTGGQLVANLTV